MKYRINMRASADDSIETTMSNDNFQVFDSICMKLTLSLYAQYEYNMNRWVHTQNRCRRFFAFNFKENMKRLAKVWIQKKE